MYGILVFALFGAAILVYIVAKAFKAPNLFYAVEQPIDELVKQLSCPKCRSRRLKQNGPYTLGCEKCEFTFSVGTVRKR